VSFLRSLTDRVRQGLQRIGRLGGRLEAILGPAGHELLQQLDEARG